MANGNPLPSLEEILRNAAHEFFGKGILNEDEEELLDWFNARTNNKVGVRLQTDHNQPLGSMNVEATTGLDAIKSFFTGQKRFPKVTLSKYRDNAARMDYEEKNMNMGIRNVSDVSQDPRFVLAHELGHELDFQEGEGLTGDLPRQLRGIYAQQDPNADIKAVDKELTKLGGDQYDQRQNVRRTGDYQIFADDLGRSLMNLKDQKKPETRFMEALMNHTRNILEKE